MAGGSSTDVLLRWAEPERVDPALPIAGYEIFMDTCVAWRCVLLLVEAAASYPDRSHIIHLILSLSLPAISSLTQLLTVKSLGWCNFCSWSQW